MSDSVQAPSEVWRQAKESMRQQQKTVIQKAAVTFLNPPTVNPQKISSPSVVPKSSVSDTAEVSSQEESSGHPEDVEMLRVTNQTDKGSPDLAVYISDKSIYPKTSHADSSDITSCSSINAHKDGISKQIEKDDVAKKAEKAIAAAKEAAKEAVINEEAAKEPAEKEAAAKETTIKEVLKAKAAAKEAAKETAKAAAASKDAAKEAAKAAVAKDPAKAAAAKELAKAAAASKEAGKETAKDAAAKDAAKAGKHGNDVAIPKIVLHSIERFKEKGNILRSFTLNLENGDDPRPRRNSAACNNGTKAAGKHHGQQRDTKSERHKRRKEGHKEDDDLEFYHSTDAIVTWEHSFPSEPSLCSQKSQPSTMDSLFADRQSLIDKYIVKPEPTVIPAMPAVFLPDPPAHSPNHSPSPTPRSLSPHTPPQSAHDKKREVAILKYMPMQRELENKVLTHSKNAGQLQQNVTSKQQHKGKINVRLNASAKLRMQYKVSRDQSPSQSLGKASGKQQCKPSPKESLQNNRQKKNKLLSHPNLDVQKAREKYLLADQTKPKPGQSPAQDNVEENTEDVELNVITRSGSTEDMRKVDRPKLRRERSSNPPLSTEPDDRPHSHGTPLSSDTESKHDTPIQHAKEPSTKEEVRRSLEKKRVYYENMNGNHEKTIDLFEKTITSLEKTIASHEKMRASHEKMRASLEKTLASLDKKSSMHDHAEFDNTSANTRAGINKATRAISKMSKVFVMEDVATKEAHPGMEQDRSVPNRNTKRIQSVRSKPPDDGHRPVLSYEMRHHVQAGELHSDDMRHRVHSNDVHHTGQSYDVRHRVHSNEVRHPGQSYDVQHPAQSYDVRHPEHSDDVRHLANSYDVRDLAQPYDVRHPVQSVWPPEEEHYSSSGVNYVPLLRVQPAAYIVAPQVTKINLKDEPPQHMKPAATTIFQASPNKLKPHMMISRVDRSKIYGSQRLGSSTQPSVSQRLSSSKQQPSVSQRLGSILRHQAYISQRLGSSQCQYSSRQRSGTTTRKPSTTLPPSRSFSIREQQAGEEDVIHKNQEPTEMTHPIHPTSAATQQVHAAKTSDGNTKTISRFSAQERKFSFPDEHFVSRVRDYPYSMLDSVQLQNTQAQAVEQHLDENDHEYREITRLSRPLTRGEGTYGLRASAKRLDPLIRQSRTRAGQQERRTDAADVDVKPGQQHYPRIPVSSAQHASLQDTPHQSAESCVRRSGRASVTSQLFGPPSSPVPQMHEKRREDKDLVVIAQQYNENMARQRKKIRKANSLQLDDDIGM